MTLKDKIAHHRIDAKDAQSATKIINSLNELKETNDENTSYRWIWELIQNAKDVANSTGKVDILIKFSEIEKVVEFSHNGKLFSTQNIVFLIEQVSTKDQEKENKSNKKSTGKFGTGFLTTHLLSEKVQVHGYVQDSNEIPQSFKTLLDRTGKYNSAIIEAIQNSCKMLEVSKEEEVEELNFNTKFIYELDEKGINTAKKGLENLLISAPYVFAFVPEVNSITLYSDNYNRKICREDRIPNKPDGASVTKVSISKTNKGGETDTETKYIFALSNDSVSIAVETTANDREIHILEPRNKLPRIFCDFPLLGTEDFAFPVVINSASFNPTEPRDGIPLKGTERADENKNIISDAVGLFNTMVNHFASKGYKNLYHVVKVPEQVVKEWLDDKWIEENLLSPVKEHIKTIKLINNSLGELSCLYDDWGLEPNLFMMNETTSELRNKVWELTSELFPEKVIKKDEVEFWYDSLWEECHNFGLVDLIREVEQYEKIDNLEKRLNCDAITWLNKLIMLFNTDAHNLTVELGDKPAIFPNQYGIFLTSDEIHIEKNIGDTYKDIAKLANIDYRDRLLDARISTTALRDIKELSLRDVYNDLLRANMDSNARAEFYRQLINLQHNNISEQEEFIDIAKFLYPNKFTIRKNIHSIQERLLADALKFWREQVCVDFSACENIQTAIEQFNFRDETELKQWISRLIELLNKSSEDSLLDKYAVLPNQQGRYKLKAELSLSDPIVTEVLKDASKYSGVDIRAEILSSDIQLNLPKNRTITLETVADTITKFVRTNSACISMKDNEAYDTFKKTANWIRDSRDNERISKCFDELIKNFHWFYNDDEIAESMAKSEQYDEILNRYNVSNIDKLAYILASYYEKDVKDNETINISKELLAQWGITSEEELKAALSKNIFGAAPIHISQSNSELFDFATTILDRAKNNIIDFLDKHEDYEVDRKNIIFIQNTIFRVKKLGQDIYIIARPSDFEQIILYYNMEKEFLDYDKDCELWVENGSGEAPQKITLGRILKITEVNRITLRSLKDDR
jgi:hypothetical protein